MKYAALIFGDDDRQPKKASGKLSPEPGQVVRQIDGSAYRVASKIAGPDGFVVKLANLQGQPVQTPPNFRPVGTAMAHFASWLKYHLAYNKDFDLYINAYIERYNQQHKKNPLPYPTGRDGKAFRWADWFQSKISPKLIVPGKRSPEDTQTIKDELIHEMLFTVLGHRNVLDQFVAKAKKLGVNRQNGSTKLTDFLISTFMYRIDEMQNKLREQQPVEEISMWQPGGEGGEEVNILEQEEHGVGEDEFQSAEARKDIGKFRESFKKWLLKQGVAGQKSGENFILMFDIFWRLLQNVDSPDDVKRHELEQEWMEKTGLSFGSFKGYFTRLPDMVEQFIMSHGTELGDKNIFVNLMDVIREEREGRERKDQRRKERARPAMVSSLNTAGVEQNFAEAISNSENPDVVDADIQQPTESAGNAAKQAGGVKRLYEDEMERREKEEREKVEVEPRESDKQAGGVKRLYEDEMEHREKEGRCPDCGSSDIDRSVTLKPEVRCNACKCMWTPGKSAGGVKRLYEDEMERREQLLQSVRPGDRVTIMVPAGMGRNGQEYTERTGRAVIVSPGHVALNMGGAHGTPGVATAENIVSVRKAKQSSTGLNCWFFEYQPGKWYYLLENWDAPKNSWDWREYASAYGPFSSEEAAIKHLQDNHANPGGWSTSPYDPKFTADETLSNLVANAPKHTRSRWGSSLKTAQKLVRGDQLTPDQIKQVEAAFIYRWTNENKRRGEVYHCDKCDVKNNPYVNAQSAEGHQHPTIPLQSDAEWLKEHAFYFTNAGKLLPRMHAVPSYLAPPEPILASIAHKFAMEKAAYNPGMGQYIYQADVYCDYCGGAIKRKLDEQGKAPETPSDEYSYDSDDYPKGPYYDQESDTPDHCARCGKFLENPLTTEGYRYLNSMITEHDERGRGSDEVIEEWKSFYPEREEYMQHAASVEKKAMLPHEFNDADNQAIRPETYSDTAYVSGEADTTEFRQPRMAADTQEWHCEDCGAVGGLDPKGGGCMICDSQAVYLVPPKPSQESGEIVRETKPVEIEKRMIPRRSPKPIPLMGKKAEYTQQDWERDEETNLWLERARDAEERGEEDDSIEKNAQGSGNTTVTMQEQNVTDPTTPGKGQPMAVPDAIDQTAGPHSPNAPATAPRSPGIQPRVVDVPAGTADADMSNTASAGDPEDVSCPECNGINIDIDPVGEEGYQIYCEDCERTTFEGTLAPGSPVRDYRETPGEHADELADLERIREMDELEGDLREPEPLEEPEFEMESADTGGVHRGDHDPSIAFSDNAPAPAGELSPETLPRMNEEEKERWLEKHGWVKENEHHGATWWLGKQMWYKKDYEEAIPYQDTDEAVEKERELSDISYRDKNAAGSNSGKDDARGAGDLWREEFYEHRTKGLSTDGLLTGMKGAAAGECCSLAGKPVHDAVLKLAEVLKTQGREAANELAKTLLPSSTKRWEALAISDAVLYHNRSKSAAAAAPAPLPPNVQQNMNLVRPAEQPPTAPGATMAIMPGEEEEQGGIKRHTVEPELPNAKYHMQGALVIAEEERLTRLAFGAETPVCGECGESKPDVMWHVFEDVADAEDPTKPLEGFYCESCALSIAQDI